MPHEPAPVAILAARLALAYPSLSAYSCASLAGDLCRIERAQRMHATRRCNGAPDVRRKRKRGEVFGYCKLAPNTAHFPERDCTAPKGMHWTDDNDAEERAERKVMNRLLNWKKHLADFVFPERNSSDGMERIGRLGLATERQGDPRGAVLLLRLPNEPEPKAV